MTRDKAGHGEGSLKAEGRLADGRYKWQWRIWAELPDGSRKRLAGRYIGSKVEARAHMQKAKAESERQGVSSDPDMTIDTLLEHWLMVKAGAVGSRTVNIYRDLVSRHLIPRIGGRRVKALTPAALQEFYTEFQQDTGLERTREQIHNVMRQALDHAVLTGVIANNPARVVRPATAKAVKREALQAKGQEPAWNRDEARKLFREAVKDSTPFGWAVAFGLQTGLRRGELMGLRWKDVDLKGRKIKVVNNLTDNDNQRKEGKLKTEQSRRTIPLSNDAVKVLEAARAWRDGEATRPGWGGTDYVFPTVDGKMQHPGNLKRKLTALCERADIRVLSPHSMRHTFATLLGQSGRRIEEVSKLLGHKSPLVTLAVYSHVFKDEVATPELDLTAPDELDETEPDDSGEV